jgi:chromosome segregation ATPase
MAESTNLAVQLAAHDVRICNIEKDVGEIKGKLNEVNNKVDDIHRISMNMERISTDVNYIKTDLSEVKENQKDFRDSQDELKEKLSDVEMKTEVKKSKLFDEIIGKVIWIFVGGCIAFLCTQLFPNVFK